MLLVCECTEDGDDVEIFSSTVDEMGVCFVLRMVRPGVVRDGSSCPAGEAERDICGDHDDSATAAGGVGGGCASAAGCAVEGDVRPPPHSLRTPFMTMSVRCQAATAGDVVSLDWNQQATAAENHQKSNLPPTSAFALGTNPKRKKTTGSRRAACGLTANSVHSRHHLRARPACIPHTTAHSKTA